jgi:hypothetical protein
MKLADRSVDEGNGHARIRYFRPGAFLSFAAR